MKNIILMLFIASVPGLSCKKSDPPAPAPLVKYMSLTAGSTWNYELVNNLTTTTSNYTLTSTTKDSTSNGKSYHVFTNSSGSANEYYNITGSDYYNFRNLPASLGGTSVENNYLKDNSPVGTSWVQSTTVTVSGFPVIITLTNKITDKGISKIVKGITYEDVIHVTTIMTISVSGVALTASQLSNDIHTYYARKFGLIQYANKISLNYLGFVENTDQLTSLISANIK